MVEILVVAWLVALIATGLIVWLIWKLVEQRGESDEEGDGKGPH